MFRLKLIKKPILLKLKTNFSFPPIVLANMQEKEVIPTKEKQEIVPDKNYDGLSKVTVNAITLQDKTIAPTVEEQIVFPDDNYNGLNKVIVNAVTNEIDENIKSENIKKGVDILGVTGNYVGNKYAPRYIKFSNYKGSDLDYEIANLDTSNITEMNEMFRDCTSLTHLDLSGFNTSKVTSMFRMFDTCPNLTHLDLRGFDTSKVTSMFSMFAYCRELKTLYLSDFDTSKLTNMYQMFESCTKLTNIPKLNASNVINVHNFVNDCTRLTDFGGLENLGQAYLTTQSANYSNYKLELSRSSGLTEQSLINVLNNLYDIKTKGCNAQQVVLGRYNLSKLTSEEGQQALSNAQAKGWTVS